MNWIDRFMIRMQAVRFYRKSALEQQYLMEGAITIGSFVARLRRYNTDAFRYNALKPWWRARLVLTEVCPFCNGTGELPPLASDAHHTCPCLGRSVVPWK